MTRPMRRIWAAAVLAATLSACHPQQKGGHGEVSGQILPGSISDAMLPYDAVKSKAPLAPPEAADRADNGGDDTTADSAATMAASADSTPPGLAASPTPTPTPAN